MVTPNPHFLSPLNLLPISVNPYILSPLNPYFLSPHHPLPVSANPYILSTAASAAGKALVVTEETESTMRVTWTPAPGKVSHYRLRHVSQGLGGREVALKIPGSLSSTVMKRLQPMTTYDIKVHPMYRHGEGKARQGVGTTRTLVPLSSEGGACSTHSHPAGRYTTLHIYNNIYPGIMSL